MISPKGMLPLDDGLLLVIQNGGNETKGKMSSYAFFSAGILYFLVQEGAMLLPVVIHHKARSSIIL